MHFWTIAEFSCLLIYFVHLVNERSIKLFFQIVGFSFILFTLYNTLFIQSIFEYNSHSKGLEATVLTLFSLIYLIYSINNESFFEKAHISINYYTIAILIYCGSNQLLYLLYNHLNTIDKSFTNLGYRLHFWFYVLFNVLLALGLGLWNRETKQK